MTLESEHRLRCDYPGCEEKVDLLGGQHILELRALDLGWIKQRKQHFCPQHADMHR